jgi:hypothetical protein
MTLRVCEHAPQASHLFVPNALAALGEPRNASGVKARTEWIFFR